MCSLELGTKGVVSNGISKIDYIHLTIIGYSNETMKSHAAMAYENNAKWVDDVEYVTYKFNGESVLTHSRWNEYWGYEP